MYICLIDAERCASRMVDMVVRFSDFSLISRGSFQLLTKKYWGFLYIHAKQVVVRRKYEFGNSWYICM